MSKKELTVADLRAITDEGTALNILWRAVAGEKINQAEQDFFHDWMFETSTPEFFKKVHRFAHIPTDKAAELARVTAERDALRKAVEVYADTKNWKCSNCVHDVEHTDGICCNDFFEPTLDGYEIAREALAQQGGDEAMEIVRGE